MTPILLVIVTALFASCDLMNSLLGIANPATTLPAGTVIAGEYDLTLMTDPWRISADDLAITAAAGEWYKITVPATSGANHGTIWGSNPYTGDSALAVAALHSGAITTTNGGVFYIETQGPDSAFYASTANGVTSLSYEPEWATSYEVYKAP